VELACTTLLDLPLTEAWRAWYLEAIQYKSYRFWCMRHAKVDSIDWKEMLGFLWLDEGRTSIAGSEIISSENESYCDTHGYYPDTQVSLPELGCTDRAMRWFFAQKNTEVALPGSDDGCFRSIKEVFFHPDFLEVQGYAALPWEVMTDVCHSNRCRNKATLRCSSCKAAWYCSKECQRGDWKKTHKARCPVMASHQPRLPGGRPVREMLLLGSLYDTTPAHEEDELRAESQSSHGPVLRVSNFPDHTIKRSSDGEWIMENAHVIFVSTGCLDRDVPKCFEMINQSTCYLDAEFEELDEDEREEAAMSWEASKCMCISECWRVSPTWRYFIEAVSAGGAPHPAGPANIDQLQRGVIDSSMFPPSDSHQHVCSMRDWRRVVSPQEVGQTMYETGRVMAESM